MTEPRNEFERIAEASDRAESERRRPHNQLFAGRSVEGYIFGRALYVLLLVGAVVVGALVKALT